jgi:hypothetical protein
MLRLSPLLGLLAACTPTEGGAPVSPPDGSHVSGLADPLDDSALPADMGEESWGTELAVLPQPNGNVITLSYGDDGGIMFSEVALATNAPTPVRGLTPTEIWDRFGAGGPAPEALVDAQAEFEARGGDAHTPYGASESDAQPLVVVPEDGSAPPPYTASSFASLSASVCPPYSPHWSWLLTDWWGGAYESDSSVHYYCAVASPEYGNGVMLYLYGQGQWTVTNGYYVYGYKLMGWSWGTPDHTYFYGSVNNASGDEFHFGGNTTLNGL